VLPGLISSSWLNGELSQLQSSLFLDEADFPLGEGDGNDKSPSAAEKTPGST